MRNNLARFFRGFSLRQRFMIAPMLGLIVCSLITAAFIHESRHQNELLSRITEQDLKAFNNYAEVFVELTQQHTALFDLFDDAGKIDEATLYDNAKLHIYAVQKEIRELEEALAPINQNAAPGFEALRDELKANAQAYQNGVSAAVGMATANVKLAPNQLVLLNERFTAMNRNFVRLLELKREGISSEITARVRQSRISSTIIALIGVSIAALLFFLSYVLSRILSRSLETQVDILTALGAQAGARIAVEGGDEVKRMTQAIAAFRQSLLELRESERRFSDLLDNVELVSLMLDREARITYCNDYLLRLTGWRREEVIGRNWFELFIPPELDEVKNVTAALLAELPEGRHYENEILTRAGGRRLIRWNNSALRSGAGDAIGTASLGEDITERRNAEAALLESRRMLRLVLDTIPVRVFWKDADSNFQGCNQAFALDAGLLSPDELVGKNDSVMGWAEQAEAYRADDRLVMDTGKSRLNYEEPQTTPEGRKIWLRTSKIPLLDAKGNVNGVLGTYEDITEQKQAEIKIKHLNRVHAVLSGINTLIVRVSDRDELFGEACRIAVEHGQFKMAWLGVVDRSTMKIVPVASAGSKPEYMAFIKDQFSLAEASPMGDSLTARAIREKKSFFSNDAQNDPRVRFKKEHIERGTRSMAVLPLLVSGEAAGAFVLYAEEADFFDAAEMNLLTELAGDIAFAIDHIGKQERLDYLAYYDALTGLANRHLFLERVAQFSRSAAGSGHKLAVFLFDLERFKNVNDSLGRPAGDELLKQVAQWLTRNLGDANLFARVGADQFAIVLPEIRQDGDVAGLVERSLAAFMEHSFRLGDAAFRIAAKVGIALFPDDGADADTLFRNAEAALKKAKASGDRFLFYTQKMTATVAGKLTLETQLRQALDNEEFVLHYQPKVNLASGMLTSVEALIRWNDPRTGLVPPGRFIPILEETGLIYDVGRWALKKAIADYLRWRAAGLAVVRVAVNVSPLQLRNRGFVDEIRQVIGIDAHAAAGLELEITESLIMEDVKHNIAALQAIRDLGVTIAIDDFGTGFSSLSYLAKLPVDKLKIDRSFVIDMTSGPQGLALVSTIINLAHSLNLKVVAEGVETVEQRDQLKALECDEMQGYLFSKPVPGEIFETKFLAAVSDA